MFKDLLFQSEIFQFLFLRSFKTLAGKNTSGLVLLKIKELSKFLQVWLQFKL